MAPSGGAREGSVAGAAPVAAAAEPVDRPHELCVEPTPALNPKRRPLARPSPMRRVRPAAMRVAAAAGSRGSPSARGSTLVPPGRNPSGTSAETPFSTSLNVPSPANT